MFSFIFFFFSSRRRHTRFDCDWSSDVCSSDLFSASDPPPDVFLRSAASTLCGFSIAGPRSRELLQKLVRLDLSAGAFRLFDVQQTAVGFAPAILTRAGFTGELGYEVWITPDYFATLYYDILAAGHDLGLTHFGGRALSSLRLEKAYGSFNRDFRPDHTPGETGLDRFVDFSKSEFTGRAAALAERGRPAGGFGFRSEEHTSELQSQSN